MSWILHQHLGLNIFQKLLNPKKTTKQLDRTGRIMRRVFVIEQYINEALPEAIRTGHDKTMRSQDVFRIIKSKYKQERVSLPEFTRVWSDLLTNGKLKLDDPALPELLFHIKDRILKAYCIYDKDIKMFHVKAGSEVRMTKTGIDKDVTIDGRVQLIAVGELNYDKKTGNCVLTTDKSFEKPSGASRFVLGRSSNGWDDWLDDKNQPLKNYRKSLDN